jgi:two-component system phosphate regulon response regulator PhoB
LTARGEERDRVLGFDSGADDYVLKPFSPAELVARIKAVLRRASRADGAQEILRCGDIEMNTLTHKVRRGGRDLHLGPTEFRLLRHLMLHPEKVFSRDDLLKSVWGEGIYVEVRTVDVHIRRLRKILNGQDGEDRIRTVRSAGYSLSSHDD